MTLALTFPAGDTTTANLAADTTGRTLAGLAVPFGVPSNPSADGHRYQFSSAPDNADELVDVVQEHDKAALVGRLSAPWEAGDTGLNAVARVFATSRGNDVLEEYREGARTGFSVGAAIHTFTTLADGVRDVTSWSADHLGVVRRPAFSSAQITVHASAQERPTMPETTPKPDVVELPTIAELAAQVAEVLKPADGTHPLAQFNTFEQFAAAFQAGDAERRESLMAAFAVPDQITTDNPGVIPPGWRSEIKMRLDARRPAISSFGSIGLPDAGMDANWPYLDPTTNLDAIIAKQSAEKTDLNGVKIKILKATEPIKTAGTVSDISYQLLMRSSPSYLAAYLRICMAAWARYTEAQFEAKLLAAGTAGGTVTTSNADTFAGQLFEASLAVQDATGSPADTVLVDKASFIALGKLPTLRNSKYSVQSVAGVASASTLRIDVNGLDIKYGPFLPANTMIVGNGDAAKFAETGPMIATEENVVKLGRDVAVWGMYEDGEVYYPAGVRIYKPAG